MPFSVAIMNFFILNGGMFQVATRDHSVMRDLSDFFSEVTRQHYLDTIFEVAISFTVHLILSLTFY